MKRYEYEVEIVPSYLNSDRDSDAYYDRLIDNLNEAGKNGWKVVSVEGQVFLLMREIEDVGPDKAIDPTTNGS